ncbi:MAG: ribonuclease III [Oscillospiraceae bacterium]|nr:ribonuclease III [Oscillospiraceae bacterium]
MDQLEGRIGYIFRDRSLLLHALTHSSYANEHRSAGCTSNERLEFLGDSVLGMTVADYLYRTFPDMPEGDLTRLRAALVCEQTLAAVARDLDLGSVLRLGHGEAAGGGRTRPSILADTVEAVLAAIYLDGGRKESDRFVQAQILTRMDQARHRSTDHKTALQELIQRQPGHTLAYRTVGETGPDHAKRFTVEVLLDDEAVSTGEGHSKKEAEQAAAEAAIIKLSR